MQAEPGSKIQLTEQDLARWALVTDFKSRVAAAAQKGNLAPTWSDPQRLLHYGDYLSLFLLGLLNPVVRTMRGLCTASLLKKVQTEVCSRPVSLGSFSEAQAVLNPDLLAQVFQQLVKELSGKPILGPAQRRWFIQDSSLFDALPRMYWCLWRRQGTAQHQVRLHLSLDMENDSPAKVSITPAKECERKVWRRQVQPGEAYVGDRYYGEDYQFFGEMEEAGVAFVVRLRDEAIINVEEELPLSQADRQANVIRAAWVRLGCKARYRSIRLRVVWVQTDREVLRLATNLKPEELGAGEVALLYKQRWQIELFFRWVKCILGCRHWLAESPQGVAIEIYLALIAALMLQLYTGQRPNRRMMELIQFYLLGVASLEELWSGLERQRRTAARAKKS
jgi:hypothetical protein